MSVLIFDPAQYAFSDYALPPLFVGIMILALGLIVLFQEKGSVLSLQFLGMTLTASVWLLSYVGIYCALSEPVALSWVKIENAAVVMIPSAVFLFSAVLIGQFRQMKFFVGLSWLLSFLFCTAVFMTSWFIPGLYRYDWGYYARYGPASFPFLIFFCTMLMMSLRLYWIEYRRTKSKTKKSRLKVFLIAFMIGYLGSVDYLPAFGIPVYPFGYFPALIFLVLVANGIWRLQIFDITPSFAAQQIIKTMADGLLVIDSEGIIRVANDAAHELFGNFDRELVGLPVSGLGIDMFKKDKFARLIWMGSVQNHEVRYTSEERGEVLLEISSSVMRNDDGEAMAMICIAKDITVRKRAEQAQRDSERHYRLLAENVTDVIWTMDMNLKLTYISPSVKRMRGISAEEAMVQKIEEMLTPASVKTVMTAIAEEITGEREPSKDPFRSKTLELEYLCKNGTTLWAEVKITFVRDSRGNPVEILGVARDITESKQAARVLLEMDRSYADFIKETPYPVIAFDRMGYLQSLNPSAEALLGYNFHELHGKHLAQTGLLNPESIAKTLQEFTFIILGSKRPPFELRMIRRNGGTVSVEANPRMIRRERDQTQVQLILREISRGRHADAA